jgi:hypothetical protein
MAREIKKILLCPFFGELPSWFNQFKEQIPRLKGMNYDFWLDQDLSGFKRRVWEILGIDCPITWGGTKTWDYRCALGLLYQNEIKDFEFWGTCDLDVVFGKLDDWITDEFLSGLDVYSNDDTYVSGHFTLYRNKAEVNELFKSYQDWEGVLTKPNTTSWVEFGFSRLLERSGLQYVYAGGWQGNPNVPHLMQTRDGKLFQGDREILLYHFRRQKRWPHIKII